VTIYGGSSEQFAELASTSDHFGVLQRLAAVVPETQLCTPAQAFAPGATAPSHANAPNHPLWRVKPFPAAKFSRYVRDSAFKFLVIELRSFLDAPVDPKERKVLCGLSWIELYGEAAAENPAAQQAALCASAAQASRAAATVTIPGAKPNAEGFIDVLELWGKDLEQQRAKRVKRGAAGFAPTGAAARALAEEQARQPPRKIPAVASATNAARPILDRNASFMQGLRDSAPAASSTASGAAAVAKPPPVCPRHPAQMLLQRLDRKTDPPRAFFVCTAKDAQGNSCDTKIWKE